MEERSWGKRILIGVLLVGLVVVVIVVNRPAPTKPPPARVAHSVVDIPGYSSNGNLEKPTATDVAEVRATLSTQAAAAKSGDRTAFLSVVDSARKGFAAHERTVWSNIEQLPFAVLTYTYDGVMSPDAPLRTPSFVARVTTSYQLKGYDAAPVQIEDAFTFVRQDGGWKLASTTDADHQFNSNALPVPWDDHPISVVGDGHYLAVVDRGHLPLAHRLLALCNAASHASLVLLGVANDKPTVLLATTSARGFKKFTSAETAAATYAVASDDAVVGWRMVLNPDYVTQVMGDPIVLTHELTHLATREYLGATPSWLSEGAAEYVAWKSQGDGLPGAEARRGWRPPHHLPSRLPISSDFYLDHVNLNYLESQALVSYIVDHYGSGMARSLFKAFARAGAASPNGDPDIASPGIVRRLLHLGPAQLTRAAYAALTTDRPQTG